jgi:hypothetical protein
MSSPPRGAHGPPPPVGYTPHGTCLARDWEVHGTALGVPGTGAVEVHCTALGVPIRGVYCLGPPWRARAKSIQKFRILQVILLYVYIQFFHKREN